MTNAYCFDDNIKVGAALLRTPRLPSGTSFARRPLECQLQCKKFPSLCAYWTYSDINLQKIGVENCALHIADEPQFVLPGYTSGPLNCPEADSEKDSGVPRT